MARQQKHNSPLGRHGPRWLSGEDSAFLTLLGRPSDKSDALSGSKWDADFENYRPFQLKALERTSLNPLSPTP